MRSPCVLGEILILYATILGGGQCAVAVVRKPDSRGVASYLDKVLLRREQLCLVGCGAGYPPAVEELIVGFL